MDEVTPCSLRASQVYSPSSSAVTPSISRMHFPSEYSIWKRVLDDNFCPFCVGKHHILDFRAVLITRLLLSSIRFYYNNAVLEFYSDPCYPQIRFACCSSNQLLNKELKALSLHLAPIAPVNSFFILFFIFMNIVFVMY